MICGTGPYRGVEASNKGWAMRTGIVRGETPSDPPKDHNFVSHLNTFPDTCNTDPNSASAVQWQPLEVYSCADLENERRAGVLSIPLSFTPRLAHRQLCGSSVPYVLLCVSLILKKHQNVSV